MTEQLFHVGVALKSRTVSVHDASRPQQFPPAESDQTIDTSTKKPQTAMMIDNAISGHLSFAGEQCTRRLACPFSRIGRIVFSEQQQPERSGVEPVAIAELRRSGVMVEPEWDHRR